MDTDTLTNGSSTGPQPWYTRTLARLFPTQPLPPEKFPAMPEQIMVRVLVHLSWVDRLRALVSGTVVVQSVVHADTAVSQVDTVSNSYVAAPGAFPKP